jgi:hypothetical protein
MFETRMIEDGLQAEENGFAVPLRLPWYRSLPLSTVELAELRVDGRDIHPDAVRLELNGKPHTLDELIEQTDEWWFVLDSALLRVDAPGVEAGKEHEIEVLLNLYPPYMGGLRWVTRSKKLLRAN